MGWFEHVHTWRPKTDLNTIKSPVGDGASGALILEGCNCCNAVRTIEFYPGKAPVVREADSVTAGKNGDAA